MKFKRAGKDERGRVSFWFYCPGCESLHMINDSWTITGLEENAPTVKPSVRVKATEGICHSFITDGKIKFLSDCFHPLANQEIDLPDVDDWLK